MNQGLEIYGGYYPGYNPDLVKKKLSATDGQGDSGSRSMILDNMIFLQNRNIQI